MSAEQAGEGVGRFAEVFGVGVDVGALGEREVGVAGPGADNDIGDTAGGEEGQAGVAGVVESGATDACRVPELGCVR